MKKWMLVVSIALAADAFAAPPTTESIQVLLKETKIERSLGGMLDAMNRTMQQQMAAATANQPMSAEQQRAMQTMQTKTAALLRSEMTWDRLEPIYVQVYQETYTHAEIDGLIAFYRTPVGRSYADKMPLALQKTFVAMQPLMASMMRKVQAIAQESVEDAKTAK